MWAAVLGGGPFVGSGWLAVSHASVGANDASVFFAGHWRWGISTCTTVIEVGDVVTRSELPSYPPCPLRASGVFCLVTVLIPARPPAGWGPPPSNPATWLAPTPGAVTPLYFIIRQRPDMLDMSPAPALPYAQAAALRCLCGVASLCKIPEIVDLGPARNSSSVAPAPSNCAVPPSPHRVSSTVYTSRE